MEQSQQGPDAQGESDREADRQPKDAGVLRVFAVAGCGFGALVGLALLLGGLAIFALTLFARDDDGFYTTPTEPLSSRAFAITSDDIELGDAEWAPEEALATLRIEAEGTGGKPMFLGVGRSEDVAGYLRGVAISRLADFRQGEVRYDEIVGLPPRGRPEAQGFWTDSDAGEGQLEASWDLDPGSWTAVLMNADGSRGVDADASIGAKVSWLIWAGVGLTVVGFLLVAGMVALTIYLTRARREAS